MCSYEKLCAVERAEKYGVLLLEAVPAEYYEYA